MILPMSADDDFQLFVMPFYTEGARYRAPMTYSILLWQRSWCAYLDGIGSFCLHLRQNSYRESTSSSGGPLLQLNVYREWKAAFNPESDKVHHALP